MDISPNPSDYPYSTIQQLIIEKADENPDQPFLIEERTEETVTYSEINEYADLATASFASAGIEKRDIVATLLPNCIDHVLVWFACMKLGAIWAPLNTEFAHDDLRATLEDIDAEAIVVDAAFRENYTAVRNEVPSIPLEIGRGESVKDAKLFGWLRKGSGSPTKAPVSPSDPAIILFTGGTTGKPKPVLHSQFAPLSGAYRYRDAYDVTPSDRHLTVLQLYHIGGQQFGVLGPMLSDISSVLVERFSASNFWDQVNEYDATLLDVLGGMLDALLLTHDDPLQNTGRLTVGGTTKEKYEQLIDLFDIDIMEPYGLTESGGILLTYRMFDPDREPVKEGKPIGKPGEWGEIAILDASGAEVPAGTTGEICLRPSVANSMMEQYYNNPEATVETWEGLWIHTDDLGWKDESGEVYFVGRAIHHLRRMGESFSAQEIESVLNEHPDIEESAVIGISNGEIAGDDPLAYVVETETVDPQNVIEWAEERLASFKVPRYIEFIDELPKSETKNELQRHGLPTPDLEAVWDRRDKS